MSRHRFARAIAAGRIRAGYGPMLLCAYKIRPRILWVERIYKYNVKSIIPICAKNKRKLKKEIGKRVYIEPRMYEYGTFKGSQHELLETLVPRNNMWYSVIDTRMVAKCVKRLRK